MESKNISYVYNTEYLEKLSIGGNVQLLNNELLNLIDDSVKDIITFSNHKINEIGAQKGNDIYSIKYLTTYPGLMFGTGYPHKTKSSGNKDDSKGQIEVGFNFDYVTGYPVYPGSSIKGVVRKPIEKAQNDPEYLKYLNKLLRKNTSIKSDIASGDVAGLLSMFEHADIFYDAYITAAPEGDIIMDKDSLTPHKNPLKDPVPISMLRIIPDVELTICIQAKEDCVVAGQVIKPDERIKLYNNIILDMGIGAKTNVGYGRLKEVK